MNGIMQCSVLMYLQTGISADTKRILLKSPTERTHEEIRYVSAITVVS